MVQLQRIGKDKVINHHHDVPYKVLNKSYTFGDENSGNKIIHGDNLEALKSLLPQYEGKIDCIYIDPPYNTGNEGRVYNDNVNDPKIKKRLNEVVGKEGEDLSRHDKWLCMMYPRLKLLHKLLGESGVIFISIDDNEQANLKLLCDEIFGGSNFIANYLKQSKVGGGSDSKFIVKEHEYCLVYGKNVKLTMEMFINHDEEYLKRYKEVDEKGRYFRDTFARPGLKHPIHYDIVAPDGSIMNYGWIHSKERFDEEVKNGEVRIIEKKGGGWSVQFKQYLNALGKKPRTMTMDFGGSIEGKNEIVQLFNNAKIFDYPKSSKYIKTLISTIPNKDLIVLDSFAGSGTTAHAVLDLNRQDGGNRKFILVELGDYAENITAERVKRVIKGYGEGDKKIEGTGGGFDFYELGEPLFIDSETLNESVGEETLRDYIRYSETKSEIQKRNGDNKYYLGTNFDTDYYFYYEKEKITDLNYDFLANIKKEKNHGLIIYADICSLSDEFMKKNNIVFKKIPRDISQF